MSAPTWFKRRTYRHLDMPVGLAFAKKAQRPSYVERHSFTPLLQFIKLTKRFKPTIPDAKGKLRKGKVRIKKRDIMYASHRDACILSYYSWRLSQKLEMIYNHSSFGPCVIAYRSLGKSNYDFSYEALRFALDHRPCALLGFDVSGFFDNLDHHILKQHLKSILAVEELSNDWYAVFKAVTKFRYVESEQLRAHPKFAARFAPGERGMIAPIAEIIEQGVKAKSNKKVSGIPQGTPISATLANLYMLHFDARAQAFCDDLGAFYRRYSDDILIICAPELAVLMEDCIKAEVEALALVINDEKTERGIFNETSLDRAQYLGFALDQSGASIRSSSLARQWRKLRRALKRTRAIGTAAIADGSADKVYTKKLRRRFSSVAPLKDQPLRNFSSYARRSADVFRSKRIIAQVRRLERSLEENVKELKKLGPSPLPASPPSTS